MIWFGKTVRAFLNFVGALLNLIKLVSAQTCSWARVRVALARKALQQLSCQVGQAESDCCRGPTFVLEIRG